MVRRGRVRRPAARALSGALVAAVALAASCEFIGLDAYPPQLQSLTASYDLKAGAAALGQTIKSVSTHELARADGSPLVLALCRYESETQAFFLLDGNSLSPIGGQFPLSNWNPVCKDYSGNIVVGGSLLSPNLDVLTTSCPARDGNVVLPVAGIGNLLLSFEGVTVTWRIWDPAWTVMLHNGSLSIDGTNYYEFSSAIPLADGGCRIALRPTSSTGSSCVVLSFGNLADLEPVLESPPAGTTLLGLATAATTITNVGDLREVVDGGVICGSYNSSSRLVRYDPLTGGEIDSKIVQRDFAMGLSFAEDGKHFSYYDSRDGQLRRFASWW